MESDACIWQSILHHMQLRAKNNVGFASSWSDPIYLASGDYLHITEIILLAYHHLIFCRCLVMHVLNPDFVSRILLLLKHGPYYRVMYNTSTTENPSCLMQS